MKSFQLESSAQTSKIAIVIAWSAFVGLVSLIGFPLWVIHERDFGWYLAPDPSPDHWTRSRMVTFFVGSVVGLLIGIGHILLRVCQIGCGTRR